MIQQAQHCYEFGPFRLDPVRRRLLRDGKPVRLTAKAFDILLALVENRERVVEKDEFLDRVWAGLNVEEGNIPLYIHTLRTALGEQAGENRYIVTHSGRGYRFVASVSEVPYEGSDFILHSRRKTRVVIDEEETTDDESSDTGGSTGPAENAESPAAGAPPLPSPLISEPLPRLLNRKVIAAGVLLIGLVSSVAVWLVIHPTRRQSTTNLLASLQVKPLVSWDSEAGEGSSEAKFSPNGIMIAYALMKNGQGYIWTKQVPDGIAHPITDGSGNCRSPIWSPDSQRIAFLSSRDNQTAIWAMPFSGGEMRLIKPLEDDRVSLKRWSKNGATIYYQVGCNLFALDIASGQITQLTNFDSNNPAQFFSVSPDEDRIAYSLNTDGRFHIFIMPIAGGPSLQVTNDEASDEYPVWLPDGKRILYSSKRNDIFQTCIAYLDEGKTEQINLGISDTLIRDVSRDGSKILFEQSREECELWQVAIEDKKETQLTSGFGIKVWPDVSPDSKSVVFQATNEAKHLVDGSILIRSLDINQQIIITSNGFNPTFSPDGSKVAFLRSSDNRFNLWAVSKIGADEKQLTTDTAWFDGYSDVPYNRRQTKDYSWSPDGSSLIYCSKKSGLWNIWQVSSDGRGEPQQVSNNNDANLKLVCPLFSPNGRLLAYVSNPLRPPLDNNSMWSIWLTEGGESRMIFSSETPVKLIGWMQSGNSLIIARLEAQYTSRPAKVRLLQVSAAGNDRNEIAQIDSAYFSNIRLAPDGRRIAYASHEEGKDILRVLSSTGGEAVKIAEASDPNVYLSGIAWSPDGRAIYYSKQRRVGLISMIENFK